jgi:hypothetical protein
MALPAAYATMSMGDINVELGRARTSTISINTAEDGGYGAINTNSSSRPSSSDPASISEWYSYNHSAAPANSVVFSSGFSYTGSQSNSFSGVVIISGSSATFNARSTSTGNFSTDTIININGNSRRARQTTTGTLNSTTFTLGPGTYSYTFSCQISPAGAGTGIGQIIFTQ